MYIVYNCTFLQFLCTKKLFSDSDMDLPVLGEREGGSSKRGISDPAELN